MAVFLAAFWEINECSGDGMPVQANLRRIVPVPIVRTTLCLAFVTLQARKPIYVIVRHAAAPLVASECLRPLVKQCTLHDWHISTEQYSRTPLPRVAGCSGEVDGVLLGNQAVRSEFQNALVPLSQ